MISPERLLGLQRWCYHRGLGGIASLVRNLNLMFNSVHIGLGFKVGRNFRIHHGAGLVIGGKVEVGDDFTCFQGVTIGRRTIRKQFEESDQIAPTIGDRVIIYAGAVVVGSIRVGDDVVIGANSVVEHDVPDGTKVPAGTVW